MTILFHCANGFVSWNTVTRRGVDSRLVCSSDLVETPLSAGSDGTWPRALAFALTHSVALSGALISIHVLPDQT